MTSGATRMNARSAEAEIGEDLLGTADWWLGVDHLVEAAELAEMTGECLWFGKVGAQH